jgi:predicted Zn-dependent protease
VVVALLGVYSAKVGAGGILVRDAYMTIEATDLGRISRTDDSVAIMDVALNSALAYAPADPVLNDMVGIVETRRGDDHLAKAREHFAESLTLRPTSAYTWAHLIEVMYRQGETGVAFQSALRRASQFGPFEPEVQRTVASYGMALWDEVEPSTRKSIGSMLSNGLRRNSLEMLQIAKMRGRLDVACRHVAGLPHPNDATSTKFCQSVEATP